MRDLHLRRPSACLWLAGDAGMEKKMETTTMSCMGTTIRSHSFIPKATIIPTSTGLHQHLDQQVPLDSSDPQASLMPVILQPFHHKRTVEHTTHKVLA